MCLCLSNASLKFRIITEEGIIQFDFRLTVSSKGSNWFRMCSYFNIFSFLNFHCYSELIPRETVDLEKLTVAHMVNFLFYSSSEFYFSISVVFMYVNINVNNHMPFLRSFYHLVLSLVLVTVDWVWIGILNLLHLFTQRVNTSHTALSLMYTLHSSPSHTH
jgi:hypothetical protein